MPALAAPTFGDRLRLLPMSDDRVETHVVIDDPDTGERRAVHFQEYWIRHRAAVPAHAVVPIGADRAAPAPGVLEAIGEADLVLLPPSNPVVSVGTILAVPGVREALTLTAAPVVGVSGIVGGDHVHGMARQLLETVEVEVSAAAVAEHYGARSPRRHPGRVAGRRAWTLALVARIEAAGIRGRCGPADDDRPRRDGRHGRPPRSNSPARTTPDEHDRTKRSTGTTVRLEVLRPRRHRRGRRGRRPGAVGGRARPRRRRARW